MRDIIQYLNEEKGKTIMISSHILEELSKIATSYGIIKDGRLMEELSREALEKKCRSHITMILDEYEKATALLEQHLHIKDYELQEQGLWIYDDVQTNEIISLFTSEHINISQIYKEKQSLEDYFLNVTEGDSHA